MGKKEKEKDKSKKYNEIRAIVREELERVIQDLRVDVQVTLNPPPVDEVPATNTPQNEAIEQSPSEDSSANSAETTPQEKS
jgi:hypothetical protein